MSWLARLIRGNSSKSQLATEDETLKSVNEPPLDVKPPTKEKKLGYEEQGRIDTLAAYLEGIMLEYKVNKLWAYNIRFLRMRLGITDDEAHKLLTTHNGDVYVALEVERHNRQL